MTEDRCGLPGWCLYVTEQWAICMRDSPFIHSNNNAAVEAQNYTGKSARAPVRTLVVRSPSMKMLLQHWPVQHSCSIWLQFVPSVKAFLKKNKRISLGFTKNRANSYSTSLRTLLRWDAGNNKPVGQHCTWREEPPQTGFTVYSQYAVYVNMSNTQATHVCLVTIEASVETAFNLPCQARVSPHPLRRERAQGRERGSTRSVKFYWNSETLVSVRHGRKWYIYCFHVDHFNKPRTDVCVDSQRVNPGVRL